MSSENLQCLLCGTDCLKIVESHVKCLNCGLYFKHSRDIMNPDQEKKRYRLHNNSIKDNGYLNYLAKLLDFIPNIEGPVLDFGCGPTKGLKALFERRGLKVPVVSYDPFFFDEELESQVFKTVYASECFEHFNDPNKTISRIKSLMTKDSTLAVRTELYNIEDSIREWWYFKDPTHVCFYTKQTFDWIAKEYDFQLLLLKSPYIILKSSF